MNALAVGKGDLYLQRVLFTCTVVVMGLVALGVAIDSRWLGLRRPRPPAESGTISVDLRRRP